MSRIECGFEFNLEAGSGSSSFTDLVHSKDYSQFVKEGKMPFVHTFCPLDPGVGDPIDVRLSPEGKDLAYFHDQYVIVNPDGSLNSDLVGMRADFNNSDLKCDRFGTTRCPLSTQ